MALMNRGDGVSFGAQNRVIASTTVDIIDDQGFLIGFITEIRDTLARPVMRVRHLSASDAGRVIGMIPQVENITINVSGFSLYDKSLTDKRSLVARLGSNMKALKSLVSQREPFNLIERETHPSTGEVTENLYFDCWVSNLSRARNIGTIAQADTATIEVAQKE